MATKTTKMVRELAFQDYSTYVILAHVYKKHEEAILYTTILLTYAAIGLGWL